MEILISIAGNCFIQILSYEQDINIFIKLILF